MSSSTTHDTYTRRRGEIEHYFDRTAADTWARLTSTAPVSRVRATVRAGRDRMRDTLLQWLPSDLSGQRVLDAGCGTGSFAIELARRGAQVLAIDLSPQLVDVARERCGAQLQAEGVNERVGGSIDFRSGDMSSPELGRFDHVVAMDSLIHYRTADAVRVLGTLADRTSGSMVVTFAPASPLLWAFYASGKLFPRSDRSPSIVPVSQAALAQQLRRQPAMSGWQLADTQRIASGFYTSQAYRLEKAKA
jgi:magnesium-protoporphyrin O-methyltransferase